MIRHYPTVIIPNLWVIQKNKMRISAPADSTLTQILRFFLAQILLKWEYTFFPSAIYGLTSCFNHYSAKTATKKNNLHSRTLTQSAALLACNPWKTESLDWSLVWDVMLIGSICVPGDRCIVGTKCDLKTLKHCISAPCRVSLSQECNWSSFLHSCCYEMWEKTHSV